MEMQRPYERSVQREMKVSGQMIKVGLSCRRMRSLRSSITLLPIRLIQPDNGMRKQSKRDQLVGKSLLCFQNDLLIKEKECENELAVERMSMLVVVHCPALLHR